MLAKSKIRTIDSADDSITLLSMAQVAERLGVATWTIERWLRAGQFPKPVYLQVGSHRKWRVRDIEAFIEKRRATRRPRPKMRGAARAHHDASTRKALQRKTVEG